MSTISRRNFLKVLGGLSLSPLVHLPPGESPHKQCADDRKVYLQVVRIAGYSYYDGMREEVLTGLIAGEELELRREPDNPYDENAIEVYTRDGFKLGYVPQIDNPIPAALADQEVAIGAEVYRIVSRDEDYPWVNMRLYMLIPEG
jgi:hypothetical protein